MELGDWINQHSMTNLYSFPYLITVASSAVGITVVQVSSTTPTLNISWQKPDDGAAITGYTVHYNKNGSGESIDVQHNTTLLIHNLVADEEPYNISVETRSIDLSGFSETLRYELCKLIYMHSLLMDGYVTRYFDNIPVWKKL